MLTNLANRKALALFGSLFAVLVPPDAPAWFSAGLLLTIIATTAGWYTLVAVTMSTDAIAGGIAASSAASAPSRAWCSWGSARGSPPTGSRGSSS